MKKILTFRIHRTESTGIFNSWVNKNGSNMLNITFFYKTVSGSYIIKLIHSRRVSAQFSRPHQPPMHL